MSMREISGFKGDIKIFLASAGTGKTTTLLNQIKDCDPLRTRFVTFSRAGKYQALQKSVFPNLGEYASKTLFTTIHALCYKALGLRSKDLCINSHHLKQLSTMIGLELLSSEDAEDCELTWEKQKSRMFVTLENLRRVNPEYFNYIASLTHIDLDQFSFFLKQYVIYKKGNNLLDYTDFLTQYCEKGIKEKDVDTLCIDEAQDLSPLQWRVLLQGFEGVKNIYIAGDDKQALFTFAGASPSFFTKLIGETKILDISYRVPSVILDWVSKRIIPRFKSVVPVVCKSANEGGFVRHIYTLADFKIIEGKSYMMLSRNRVYLRLYTKFCQERGLLYRVNFKNPFSEKDMMNYIKRGKEWEEWPNWKKDYFQRVGDKILKEERVWIDIATIHSCKGTEADYVVLTDSISKNSAKTLAKDPDSEHRVFYVGCTRAKIGLYILHGVDDKYPYLRE